MNTIKAERNTYEPEFAFTKHFTLNYLGQKVRAWLKEPLRKRATLENMPPDVAKALKIQTKEAPSEKGKADFVKALNPSGEKGKSMEKVSPLLAPILDVRKAQEVSLKEKQGIAAQPTPEKQEIDAEPPVAESYVPEDSGESESLQEAPSAESSESKSYAQDQGWDVQTGEQSTLLETGENKAQEEKETAAVQRVNEKALPNKRSAGTTTSKKGKKPGNLLQKFFNAIGKARRKSGSLPKGGDSKKRITSGNILRKTEKPVEEKIVVLSKSFDLTQFTKSPKEALQPTSAIRVQRTTVSRNTRSVNR